MINRYSITEYISTNINISKDSVINLENYIFENYDTFYYKQKIRSLIFNYQKYDSFKKFVHINVDNIQLILDKKPWEIDPELWEESFKKLYKKELDSKNSSGDYLHEVDGLYKCRKCKSMKTKHRELQTRSADEPATIYVYCTQCFNVYKIN